mmetsp:Transcript_6118/g.19442  ORF Transcript_6118/g.19442 Transcript_6118/m.19442 type:complete len:479 (-) Transcript_6118:32-1468(-)
MRPVRSLNQSLKLASRAELRRRGAGRVVGEVVRVVEPCAEELERRGGLELGHHVARAADREEVEVLLVARHVAAHALAAVERPGPPGLRRRVAEARRPVLGDEGVDARVRVAVVDEAPQTRGRRAPVDGQDVRLRRAVVHADAVVAVEEVRGAGHVERVAHGRRVDPERLRVAAAAVVVVDRAAERRRRVEAPPKPFLVDAVVVEVVLEVAADLRVDLVEQELAARRRRAAPAQVGHAARVHDVIKEQVRHLAVAVEEDDLVPGHVNWPAEHLRARAAVADGEALELRAHRRRVVVEDPLDELRDVDARIAFSRQVQVVAAALGEEVEPALERRVGRPRHALVVPVAARVPVARRVVAALAEADGRRPVEHEHAAELRPAVLVVEEARHARLLEGRRPRGPLVEHERPELDEDAEHRRRAGAAVRPQDGRVLGRVALALVVEVVDLHVHAHGGGDVDETAVDLARQRLVPAGQLGDGV